MNRDDQQIEDLIKYVLPYFVICRISFLLFINYLPSRENVCAVEFSNYDCKTSSFGKMQNEYLSKSFN